MDLCYDTNVSGFILRDIKKKSNRKVEYRDVKSRETTENTINMSCCEKKKSTTYKKM